MHRTRKRLVGLLGLVLGLLPTAAWGQVCTPESKPLVVMLNEAVRLQMASKRPLKTVINPKEAVLQIRTIERDPSTIIVTGTQPGITRVELEDTDGNRETRLIHVQADVEYLSSQLRRAVPLGNIQAIPNGTNSVILAGFVNRAEDIQVAIQVATSVGFQPIPAMRVTGVQQVQLDVVIARVRRSKSRNFGFNFLQNSRSEIFGSTVGNLIPAVGNIGATGVLTPTRFGQNISSAPGQANIFGGILSANSGFLGFLQALEQENLAKLLAQPRLVTLSGNPASFLDGGEQAIPVPAGLGQVGVQFEEFGTRLNFLPIVLGNGKIHLEVEPEVSALDPNAGVAIAGATVAGRATQRIHTTVEMETGQTFVIGGLIQKTVTGTTNKIPVLGQLPFVGTAFSTKTFAEDEAELVVMVTPHLVDAQSCDQVTKVLPGQESRSPDDFELFLEGILEAPRGPREVFQGKRYVPVHHTGPTADLFPCAGKTRQGVETLPAAGAVAHPAPSGEVAVPTTTAPGAPQSALLAPLPPALPAAASVGTGVPGSVMPAGDSFSAETPRSNRSEPAPMPSGAVVPAGGGMPGGSGTESNQPTLVPKTGEWR